MKKNSIIAVSIVITALSFVCCTYDYNMPDFSNAYPIYSINDVSDDMRRIWIEEAKVYGLTFEVAKEKWEKKVIEYDANDNVLYSGEARGKADRNAKKLKVGYTCLHRISSIDNNYYEVCTFWIESFYPLSISPFTCYADVSANNRYTIEPAPANSRICPFNLTWDSSITNLMVATTESLGYEISGTELEVIERDINDNIIYQGSPLKNFGTDYISHKGAYSIEFLLGFYGWPKDSYRNMAKIGVVRFAPIKLEANMSYTLNDGMEYNIEKSLTDSEYIYAYNLTWDSSITNLMATTTESLGYETSGTELEVIERDINDNIIYQVSPQKNSGTDYITNQGAYTIEFHINFHGWPKGSYRNKVKIGAIIFTPLRLTPNMETILTSAMEHTIQTYI